MTQATSAAANRWFKEASQWETTAGSVERPFKGGFGWKITYHHILYENYPNWTFEGLRNSGSRTRHSKCCQSHGFKMCVLCAYVCLNINGVSYYSQIKGFDVHITYRIEWEILKGVLGEMVNFVKEWWIECFYWKFLIWKFNGFWNFTDA